jgi:hypothetical protein
LNVTANYTWDSLGRLLTVTSPYPAVNGSVEATFAYDGLGRRVSIAPQTYNGTSWVAGNVEYYVWDGDQIADHRREHGDELLLY